MGPRLGRRGEWGGTTTPSLPAALASMGPRLGRRGELRVEGRCTVCGKPLQWGHGSVAVENARAVPARAATSAVLQWGHGSVAVENGGVATSNVTSATLQWGHGSVAV